MVFKNDLKGNTPIPKVMYWYYLKKEYKCAFNIREAAGYEQLEDAKVARDEFDEPEQWKIIEKEVIFRLIKIIEE